MTDIMTDDIGEMDVKKKKGLLHDIKINKAYYLMLLPVLIYFIVFSYIPMGGLVIAFQNFRPACGILGSSFVGLKNFIDFFNSVYFGRVLRNTVIISLLSLLICFPLPIIFALLLNEVRRLRFKKAVQTITYMPYFISLVVLAGIIIDFTSSDGILGGTLMTALTGESKNLLADPQYFRAIMTVSELWQGLGYSSIIYVATLSAVDQQLYEAAAIDGANRWQQTIHITIPEISSTIIIMLILKCGTMLAVGAEKIILLYNANIYETADVISTFVYRKGLQEFNYGYSTAVGMFNSVINFVLIVVANKLAKKFSDTNLF